MNFTSFSLMYHPWMVDVPFCIFLFVLLIYVCILYYHWVRYGMGSRGIIMTEFVFFVGLVVFLYTMFLGFSSL